MALLPPLIVAVLQVIWPGDAHAAPGVASDAAATPPSQAATLFANRLAQLPVYSPQAVSVSPTAAYVDPTGAIRIGGAEHVSYLVTRFDARFADAHPGVRFTEHLSGTTTALPLLTAGTILFAPVGRNINGFEKIAYHRAVGGTPLEIRVAHASNDTSQHLATSLAVYVNRANPMTQISMRDLRRILSVGNAEGDLSRWGQVGLAGKWQERGIHVYGTPEYSGFGDYLQESLLARQPLNPETEHYGSTGELLSRLALDPAGLAVAGINREDKNVKALALVDDQGRVSTGTVEEVLANRYPLGRYLYFYLRQEPGKALDPVAVEYLRLVLSRDGQAIVASQANGYMPLSADEAQAELDKIDRAAAAPQARSTPSHTGHGEAIRDDGASRDSRDAKAGDLSRRSATSALSSDQAATISIVGGNGMTQWAERLDTLYQRAHPGIALQLTMKGSATALPALTAGTADIAPMTRGAFLGERAGFKQAHGYLPEVIKVGYQGYVPRDAGNVPPAVYVNRLNPLPGVTMRTLARIFTSGQPDGDLSTWSQLAPSAIPDACRGRIIHLYGGRDDGGATTLLRREQFGGQPFAVRYEALPNEAAVIAAVADDVCGMGLAGWADPRQWSAQVRVLALGKTSAQYVEPTYDAVAAGLYPLSPKLLLYFNREPGKPLPERIKRYLSLALSDEGQAVMAGLKDNEGGFVPLSAADLAHERARLNSM